MLENTKSLINGWGKTLHSPKFIEVKYEDKPTDIEVAVFCSHDRGTHKEVVDTSFWSAERENSVDSSAVVEVCDRCSEELDLS